jgi:hypothetical protein
MTQGPIAFRTHFSRRGFIGVSDAVIVTGTEDPARICEWSDLSGKPRPSQPCDRAGAGPPPSAVCAAHAEFVAALAGAPPRTIPIDADAIDLEDRADHLSKVLSALSVYLAVILDDTAQNVPGRLDLPDVEAHLADLAGDVVGTIEHAADDMPWRIA